MVFVPLIAKYLDNPGLCSGQKQVESRIKLEVRSKDGQKRVSFELLGFRGVSQSSCPWHR